MIYRTLRESQALHDYSNQSLRFNRTLEDAGWPDDLQDDDGYHPEFVIVYGFGALVLTVGGVVAWVL